MAISFQKKIIFILTAFACCGADAWTVLAGNETTRSSATFTFDVGPHFVQRENSLMFVGSAQADAAKEYALSRINLHKYAVEPFAPARITRNTTNYDQPNPLYNAEVAHIVCPSVVDVVVNLTKEPPVLYNVNSTTAEPDLLALALVDDTGNPIARICKLATNGKGITYALVKTVRDECALVSVSLDIKHDKEPVSEDEFAKLSQEVQQMKQDDPRLKRLKGSLETDQEGKKFRKKVFKTFKQISYVRITADLVGFGNSDTQIIDAHDLCWHTGTERLYIGLSVLTGSAHSAQACAILVARMNADNSISLEPILGADCLARGHEQPLVAASGAHKKICVKSLAALRTTTGLLDYLIVQADNQVFALPLANYWIMGAVPESKQAVHGTLADVSKNPLSAFESRRMKFLGRHFSSIATCPDHLYTRQTSAAWVGAGPLVAGAVGAVLVQGDVIYALVNDPYEGYEAGLYESRALFAANGAIAGWSIWQKTVGVAGLDFMVPDSKRAQFLAFSADCDSENGTRTAAVNTWPEKGTSNIGALINAAYTEFSEQQDTIKKVFDFSVIHPGLHQMNLTVLMSNSKMMIAQFPEFKTILFDELSISPIGTPTCAQIGINDQNGWIFIGGTRGLGYVCDENGNGWRMPEGLTDIAPLQQMKVKKLGDYTMVRKLIFDAGCLYVLTDESFDRIDLQNGFRATRLATIKKLINQRYSIFYDAIVSDSCALITTSAGMFRVGNNCSIQTDDEHTLNWTLVNVPDATDSPLFLIPTSVSGNANDWARGVGQVYIITGSYTKQGARVHRYAVDHPEHASITDQTIMPVADLVIKDHYSDIGSLLMCSDCFATDGLYFFAPVKPKKNKPMLLYNGLTRSRTLINVGLEADDVISCITRNSYYGNWLIAGSFGLKTNI